MCWLGSVIGALAEAVQPRGAATIWSTAAANRVVVQAGLVPQLMPSSPSTRYWTRVVPVPTMSVPPGAGVKVPAPCTGTPSAPGGGSFAPPRSPPVLLGLVSVLDGLGLGFALGLGDGVAEGDGLGEGEADGESSEAAGAARPPARTAARPPSPRAG